MRIDEMTLDQLLKLNDVICQLIDELKEQKTLQVLNHLRIGLKIIFSTREGPAFGIITKINRKSVIVLAEDGTKQYKVSPELLTPLHEVK